MRSFPHDFLSQVASSYELSPEQKKAFIQRCGSNKGEREVAQALHISPEALRSRMTGIYNKFSIRGKGPGKLHKLLDILDGQYQKSNPSPIVNATEPDIDALVQEVREKVRPTIQDRCGTMRVLDMTQPIGLGDIYTNVNILEKITGRQRQDVTALLQKCNSSEFDRFGLAGLKQKGRDNDGIIQDR